jgi:hypothetical protein
MNALWWQYAVITLLVTASALSVLRKYLPSLWGRALALLAAALQWRRLPALLHRAGARLQAAIPAAVGGSCASAGGCSSCGACGSSDPVPVIKLAPPQLRNRS